jgi:hypothetical protein
MEDLGWSTNGSSAVRVMFPCFCGGVACWCSLLYYLQTCVLYRGRIRPWRSARGLFWGCGSKGNPEIARRVICLPISPKILPRGDPQHARGCEEVRASETHATTVPGVDLSQNKATPLSLSSRCHARLRAPGRRQGPIRVSRP